MGLSAQQWRGVLAAYGRRCYYCGDADSILTRDHLIPGTRGGGDTVDNVVPACRSCNSRKGTRTAEEYREYLAAMSAGLPIPEHRRPSRRDEAWTFGGFPDMELSPPILPEKFISECLRRLTGKETKVMLCLLWYCRSQRSSLGDADIGILTGLSLKTVRAVGEHLIELGCAVARPGDGGSYSYAPCWRDDDDAGI